MTSSWFDVHKTIRLWQFPVRFPINYWHGIFHLHESSDTFSTNARRVHTAIDHRFNLESRIVNRDGTKFNDRYAEAAAGRRSSTPVTDWPDAPLEFFQIILTHMTKKELVFVVIVSWVFITGNNSNEMISPDSHAFSEK